MEVIVKKYDDLTLDELYDILRIRVQVFVVEQEVPYNDLDGKDNDAYHVFIREDNQIKAYLRILCEDASNGKVKIGRVLTTERGKGYGRLVMEKGIETARKAYNPKRINIHSQDYVIEFYEKLGFKQVSDVFIEEDRPHVSMDLELE